MMTISAACATRRTLLTTVAMGLALAIPAAAFAQQTSAPSRGAKATGSTAVVEEVVVTAQLREQSLQEVPISAIVMSGKELATQNLNNLNTLTQAMPSVHVGNTVSAADLYIRGAGSGANASFDEVVGTFIDGIYYGRGRLSSSAFFDLDHLEVLKGPQSTFFGNNAIAGAINIATRAPSSTFTGSGRVLYGTYGDRAADVGLSGPITDTLSVRLALHYDGTNGWLSNEVPANQQSRAHLPASDNEGGRLTLLYKPTDDLSIKLKTEYTNNQSNGLGLQDTQCPPTSPLPPAGFCLVEQGLGLGNTVGLDKNIVTNNTGQGVHLQTEAEVLTVNYDLGGNTLTSITGHTHYNFDSTTDIDGTPQWLGSALSVERYDQVSQEFRIASPTGKTFEWLAGVYLQADKLYQDQQQYLPYLTPVIQSKAALAALLPVLPITKVVDFDQTEQSRAAFGSISWHPIDKLTLTGGLRYTWVHKAFNNIQEYGQATSMYNGLVLYSGAVNPQNNGAITATGLQALASAVGLGPAGTEQASGSYHALLPSAKVQYQFTPDVMGYVSYAKGFLAGGFNGLESTGILANAAYRPEIVNAYEVGVKSRLFGGRVVLNADAFYSKFDDFQVTQSILQLGSVRSLVTNAASVVTQGVEVDGVWRATEDLRVSGNVTYDDAHYGSYQNVAQNTLGNFCHAAANIGNAGCISAFGGKGDPGALRDLTGQETPFAPKWSGAVTASYGLHKSNFTVTPSVTGVFSSSYFPSGSTLNDPVTQQPAYVRIDGQITLVQDDNSRWAVDLIGKNLTDRNIVTAALLWPNTAGGSLKAKEELRSVALQLRLNW